MISCERRVGPLRSLQRILHVPEFIYRVRVGQAGCASAIQGAPAIQGARRLYRVRAGYTGCAPAIQGARLLYRVRAGYTGARRPSGVRVGLVTTILHASQPTEGDFFINTVMKTETRVNSFR